MALMRRGGSCSRAATSRASSAGRPMVPVRATLALGLLVLLHCPAARVHADTIEEATEARVGEAVFIERGEEAAGAGRTGVGEPRVIDYTATYNLVEPQPDCRFVLGADYCPEPASGKPWTDLYMSYLQRTQQTLMNMARIDPTVFQTKYMLGVAYSCTPAVLPPLQYSANLQQSASQQARFISDPSCSFQHPTCSKYCYLYGGSCMWYDRLGEYETTWVNLAENIAMTTPTDATEPMGALMQWLQSSGHCTNIYSTKNNHMGTGSVDRFWVQNFARVSYASSSPLVDGSHYSHSQRTGGSLRFLANVYATDGDPQAVYVNLNGVWMEMSLHLGTKSKGTYFVDASSFNLAFGCLPYYFWIRSYWGDEHTLPATGVYYLVSSTCSTNYNSERSGGSDVRPDIPPSTNTKAPSPFPTATPSKSPTKAPSQAPTKIPTATPSKSPTKSPSLKPTLFPSKAPSKAPTKVPSEAPSKSPTKAPSQAPTKMPTATPSKSPTKVPSQAPTRAPSTMPTTRPTKSPTQGPTARPPLPNLQQE